MPKGTDEKKTTKTSQAAKTGGPAAPTTRAKPSPAAGRVASGRRPRTRPAERAVAAGGPASLEARLSSTRPAAGSATRRGREAVPRPDREGASLTGPRRRKTKVGRVVSAKAQKTVIVEIERLREHPLYKKVIRVRKRFAAHDGNGDVREGDLVRIQESRPFSATKRWQVVEVISRAGEAGAAAPRVAEVEKALEEAEGVTEILAPTVPESRPKADAGEASPPPGGSDEA